MAIFSTTKDLTSIFIPKCFSLSFLLYWQINNDYRFILSEDIYFVKDHFAAFHLVNDFPPFFIIKKIKYKKDKFIVIFKKHPEFDRIRDEILFGCSLSSSETSSDLN